MSTPSLSSPQPLHRPVSQRTVTVVGLIVAIVLAVTLLAVASHPKAQSGAPVLHPPVTPAALAYQADAAHGYAISPPTTAAQSSDAADFGSPVINVNASADVGARLHRGLEPAVAAPVAAGSTELSSGMGHR
jgi:hypothetical protein